MAAVDPALTASVLREGGGEERDFSLLGGLSKVYPSLTQALHRHKPYPGKGN